MCVGCRRHAPKQELVRIVATTGGIVVDASGSAAGRGAYVCSRGECFEQAIRRGRLQRALRTAVSDEDIAGLSEEFEATV